MIQSASIPAIVMAGVKLYVAAYFLLVWARSRHGRENLTFALTCLGAVLYDIGCAGAYSAGTTAEGAWWQWFQRLTVSLDGVAFAWFIADYTRQPRRVWLWLLTTWGGSHFVLLLLGGRQAVLSDIPAIKTAHLPWGQTVVYHELEVVPLGYTLEVFGAALFALALVAGLRQYRAGDHGRARPLLVAVVILWAGVLNDTGLSLRFHSFIYLIEYSFLALVVMMSYRLAGEHRRFGEMEVALRENERRYRNFVEGTSDIVLQVSAEGWITFANRGAAETLGVEVNALVGQSLFDLLEATDRQRLREAVADWLAGRGAHPRFETRLHNAADEPIDVLWTVTPVTDDEQRVVAFNAIGRDITDLKRVEEEAFARFQRLERQQEAILRLTTDETVVAGDVARAARRITEAAAETLGVARVAVWRVTEDGRRITCLDLFERERRSHTRGLSLTIEGLPYYENIVRDRVVASHDALGDARLTHLRESYLVPLGVGALLDAPVRVGGFLVGTVSAEHLGGPRNWLDDEILFVGELADQMAQALLNADQRKAEASLRASEARYRSMMEAMDDQVYICSADHRLQYMNAALVRRTGRNATGELCHEALYGLRGPCSWCTAGQGGPSESHKWEITSPKDGRTYHVSTVPIHNADASVSTMAIIRDITEMREAEAERVLLSAAIEQAAEIVVVTDVDGVIQYVNPAFEQVTGYPREEVLGQTPRLLKSGKQDASYYKDLWETILSGKTWNGRLTNRRKNGTLYMEEAVISPVLDHTGRTVSFVGVKRDITQQTRLEEQLRQAQKMEAVGQLAGGVAHDFNNLLTPILGYAELLQARFPADDPTHGALGEIRRAGEGARRLTAQLLAFGRKQMIEVRVLELGGLVARMSRMLRRTIREDIEIVYKRAGEPSPVRVDASQIEQVLMNLAVNAQDAMPQGGRMIIETENVVLGEGGIERPSAGLQPGRYTALSVSDSGLGMDAETLSHLFEPFFTTKEKGKGTGLGLATAYGIVKQHRGEITVYSEPGRGSTFRVYLPRSEEGLVEAERPAAAAEAKRGDETIVVVEDNPMVRNLASRMLQAHGYTVLTATGGEDCLRQIDAHLGPLHLLLADVIMPGMNGREVHQRVAALRPDIRVLYMSGYTEDVITPQGVMEQGVDFIAKPFSVESLTRKVREILDR